MTRELLQQALDALNSTNLDLHVRAMDAIRAHLDQPERPINCGSGHCSCIECVAEPAWHDAPTVPGNWICNEWTEVPYDWRAFDINKQILDLTPPTGERWFGPIPKDKAT